MYLSNNETILLEERTKTNRFEILRRLYFMEFNLIPMNGKKPCVEWKLYQTQRVTPEEIKEWMSGRFPTKDGKSFWKAEILNFALITGAVPWSDDNPGVIVVDSDDAEAEALVRHNCPQTPMMQVTGSGNKQFVYQRPPVELVQYIGNSQKIVIGGDVFNLDIRGDGDILVQLARKVGRSR